MSVFNALLTAVAGLRAQAFALANISGNIANSQTTSFKRVDNSFVDLVPDAPFRREFAGSVSAYSRSTNTIQGDLQTTNINTHMALNGSGYFAVQERTGYANNQPVFGGTDFYTRRGDFTLDKDGYLTNGAGYYLKGTSIDPTTGQVSGASSGIINISSAPIPAKPSTEVVYKANLPSYPATSSAVSTTPQSELINPAAYSVNPLTTGANTVVASDQQTFLSQSIPGGSITLYNDVGAPVNLQMRWAKVSSSTYGQPDVWNKFYLENSNATGAQVAWRNMGTPVTFNSSGQMTSAPRLNIPALTVNGTSVGSVDIAFGSTGLTQFSDANGQAKTSSLTQNGYPSGALDRIGITSDGRISGNYTNGQVLSIAVISIATFNADNALKRSDGGVFEQTLESGTPSLGGNTATIVGGSLEGSNVDIAQEFSKMIITQQAYSANTRVISTSQQMLSEIINIIR
jgi:flagellar hook protein FlgE